MQLLIVTEAERQKWLENYRYLRELPGSSTAKATYFRAAKAEIALAKYFDRDQPAKAAAFLRLGINFRLISAEPTTPVSQLISDARAQFKSHRIDSDNQWDYRYRLVSPLLGEIMLDPNKTAGEVGLRDGELVILHRSKQRKIRDPRLRMSFLNDLPAYEMKTGHYDRFQEFGQNTA